MKYYVALTDYEWFEFLRQRKPDEVNFWRPGGQQSFPALETGGPFVFKLHGRSKAIAGLGFFMKYTRLPLSYAWKVFQEKNGASDFSTLLMQILKYRGTSPRKEPDPLIGCTILANPCFFDEQDWVSPPHDWSPSIVQGKGYDTSDPTGADLWDQIQQKLHRYRPEEPLKKFPLVAEPQSEYDAYYLARQRPGQGTFRVLVTEAYERQCAITGERALPVLEASHIKPFSESGPNIPPNGLLLRADLHILFDSGYITVTKDYDVEVSRRIKEDFDNGRNYYEFHGKHLKVVPRNTLERPSREFIEWHNENAFRG